MDYQPAVYIMANRRKGTLYIGVTSNLPQRCFQHRSKVAGGFTSRYNLNRLVYFELHDEIEVAIAREKQLKNGPRERKVRLIESMNPAWRDLAVDIGVAD